MTKQQQKKAIELFSLKNKRGTQLEILNFGATVFGLLIDGQTNVVVGPKEPETYISNVYLQEGKHFGASVGRHAGRISKGGFEINGQKFPLFGEEGIHLHGGKNGFTYKFWELIEHHTGKDPFVVLEYNSPDGEEGYPGNLRVQVKYTLQEDNAVKVEYSAETDRATIVNLTNHTYFNLNGCGSINNHELKIAADVVLETGKSNVPTGNLVEVDGREIDFREAKRLENISLDTTFCLANVPDPIFLKGDKSGISLEIETNQPAVVVYIPPTLPRSWDYATVVGEERAGICLEAQKFPDAPHHENFPSVLLSPGELYKNQSLWKFRSGS
ncbi:aldose epimerase family protein [Salinimicrobium oceani]|uniref:Aldose 1-epimerase n=1 Tax=Salinimicrobium oceani TaxID=2722702 RepID=A0ABX1CVZ2_9FLAO|nr:aldose epimerase family protein [Salinimicrobium oceani]NJW51332.1 galactose mutarotase [Salinimicrobium oceani]